MANWWEADAPVTGGGNYYQGDEVVGSPEQRLVAVGQQRQQQQPQDQQPLSWSEVGSQALQNAPGSAYQFGSDLVQPILHPLDTLYNVSSAGRGYLQKGGLLSGTEDIPSADAINKYFADRYGGIENFKRALATDPVGVAGDISTIFTGGEMALARAPGIVGKVGQAAGLAARATDPLAAVSGTAKLAGRLGSEVVGLSTGAGGQSIRTAAQAGREGGEAGQVFRENLRGNAPIEDTINEARGAVDQIRRERGTAYRQNMQKLGQDQTILSWNDVDTALNDMNKVATYKGQSLSPSTEAIRTQITNAIDNWKNLRASEFWTPEGFDALKKQVGDIKDAAPRGTPERAVAEQAYNAIRKTIVDQSPEYAKYMKTYEDASRLIKEMEGTLSLNPNARIDTTLRKLQSVLRNNVTTSYGRRADLAEILANSGAPNLMNRLAGQALNAWMPRGLASRTTVAGSLPALAAGVTSGFTGASLAAGATLPAFSPRLVGEAAYGAGAAGRRLAPLSTLLEPSRQLGRLPGEPPDDPKRIYIYPEK